jgi:hypothetical protein
MLSVLENLFVQEGGKQQTMTQEGGRRRRGRGTRRRRGRGKSRRTRRH